jgi:WD40 repeat protein
MPPQAAAFDPAKTKMALDLKHASPLLGARFDPSGQFVFAGAQDNNVIRWELANQKKTVLEGHRSWIRSLAFHAESKKVLSADYNGKVLIWSVDAAEPKPERILDAHRGWVRAIAMAPDGRTFATCGNDQLVKLWSFPQCNLLHTFEGHDCHVYNVAFHPTAKRLVSGDHKGIVRDWDLEKKSEVRNFNATAALWKYDSTFRADVGGVRSMTFSPDGSILACGGITNVSNAFAGIGNPCYVLFNWEKGVQQNILRPQPVFQGVGWGVQFHPSGKILGAAGGSGGVLLTWNGPDQANSAHSLTLPNNARDLHLHPDARRLAIPFFDGSVRIYELNA